MNKTKLFIGILLLVGLSYSITKGNFILMNLVREGNMGLYFILFTVIGLAFPISLILILMGLFEKKKNK